MIRQLTSRRPRYVADLPVKGTLLRPKGEIAISGRCTVMSETGLGCHLGISVALGELVTLHIPIPNTPIQILAEIRYQSGDYYGLEFIGLNGEERDGIIRYCRHLPIKPEES